MAEAKQMYYKREKMLQRARREDVYENESLENDLLDTKQQLLDAEDEMDQVQKELKEEYF